MRFTTAANRRAPRSLAGHAAREGRVASFIRHLTEIYPALQTGKTARTHDSGRGLTTHFVPQTSCGADS